MSVPTESTTVVSDGLARFTSRYRDKATLNALASTYLASVQELEGVVWDLIDALQLKNPVRVGGMPAYGIWLDYWGKLVGQPRNSMGDTDYRTAIQLRIAANKSGGRAEDIIKIAAAIANPNKAKYVELYPAAFIVEISNINGVLPAPSLLSEAKPGGVRGCLTYTVWPDGGDFVWGSVYSPSVGTPAYGSVYSGSAGGLIAAGAELTKS